jgi:hypothetical protein
MANMIDMKTVATGASPWVLFALTKVLSSPSCVCSFFKAAAVNWENTGSSRDRGGVRSDAVSYALPPAVVDRPRPACSGKKKFRAALAWDTIKQVQYTIGRHDGKQR